MVSSVAIGACRVVGSAYRVTVGLEPMAVTGPGLGESTSVGPGQQLFGCVRWWRKGHVHLVGCLRPDDLPDHPAS